MTGLAGHTVTLETERLTLVPPGLEDWPGFHDLMTSEVSQYAGGNTITPRAWHSFAGHLGQWVLRGFGLFSVRVTDEDMRSVGMVGPYYPEGWPETELGWILWRSETGKGYATEAAIAARAYVYETLGWANAVSYIAPENTASIAVAERLRCIRDAKPRGLHDEDTALVYRHPGPVVLQ